MGKVGQRRLIVLLLFSNGEIAAVRSARENILDLDFLVVQGRKVFANYDTRMQDIISFIFIPDLSTFDESKYIGLLVKVFVV